MPINNLLFRKLFRRTLATFAVIGLMAVISLISGCTEWGFTKATYRWKADKHIARASIEGKNIDERRTVQTGILYELDGDLYSPCQHETGGKKEPHHHMYARWIRPNKDLLPEAVGTTDRFVYKEGFMEENKREFIHVSDETKDKIDGSGGYVVWRVFGSGVPNVCYYLKFNPGERGRAINSIPDGGMEAHDRYFYYLLQHQSTYWHTQGWLLALSKIPVYILTIPADVITGPLQHLDFRVGP